MNARSEIDAAGQERILVDHGNLILVADYSRDGEDLILTGPDGAEVAIIGYFADASPADLTSGAGATVPSDIIAQITQSPAAGAVQRAIGTVVELEGVATATLPGGSTVTLIQGDAVYQDALIETGPNGSVGIQLLDGTRIGLSPNGRLLLDEFVFDPITGAGTSALAILQGVLATVTGEIGKTTPDNVTIQALSGTIGIRGTTVVVEVDGVGEVTITVVEGEIFVNLLDDTAFQLDDIGDFVTIQQSGEATLSEGGEEHLAGLFDDPKFRAALQLVRALDDAAPGESDSGAEPPDGSQSDELMPQDGSLPSPEPAQLNAPQLPNAPFGDDAEDDTDSSGSTEEQIPVRNATPEFEESSYLLELPENLDGRVAQVPVGRIAATDPDGETVSYSIVAGNDDGAFAIDPESGDLVYVGAGEDFEAVSARELTVRATDPSGATADADVTVSIQDVDETPAFDAADYAFSIDENVDGSRDPVLLGAVAAGDPDGDALAYSIVAGNDDGAFAIDPESGSLSYVGTGEDFEAASARELTVRATDPGGATADADVTVSIQDVAEAPAFDAADYAFSIDENVDGSRDPVLLGAVAAGDPDGGALAYSIVAGNDDGAFAIDPESGSLSYVGTGEDFEAVSARELTVRATDSVGATADADVTVAVGNVDETPAFDAADYAFAIDENVDGSRDPVLLGAVAAGDPDGDALAYSIVAGNDDGAFAIDPESGSLSYVGTGEDFEAVSARELTVRATDPGGATADAAVTVAVGNVDETPAFDAADYAFAIDENVDGSRDPVLLGAVAAGDPDGDALAYSIVAGNDDGAFAIDPESGSLSYVGTGEDFEAVSARELTVRATDPGGATADAAVTVAVGNVDETPAFDAADYAFAIDENVDGSRDPVLLGAVAAGDPDGDALAYSIVAGNDDGAFAIDPESGSLSYVGAGEDFEAVSARELTVRATDPGGATADADVTVAVGNVDEAPAFDAADYAFAIDENVDGSRDPVLLGAVAADDPDGGALAYSIVAGNDDGAFAIDPESGSLSYVGTGEDFEAVSARELTVRATDPGGATADADVTVSIQDVAEAPAFDVADYAFSIDENVDGSRDPVLLGAVAAGDPDGDALAYSIVAGNDDGAFAIDPESGSLSYVGTGEDFEAASARELTVRATDPGGASADAAVTVAVGNVDEAPAFVAPSYFFVIAENVDGSVRPFAFGAVAADDPEGGALAYSIVAGNDDGAFAIDPESGSLSYVGTGEDFEAVSARELTVRATDPGGATADADVTVSIQDVDETPAFDAADYAFAIDENVDGSRAPVLLGAVAAGDPDGDALAYSIVAGNDDGAFAIDPESGNLSYVGTGEDFEAASARELTVRATDPGGASADAAVTVAVGNVDEAPAFVAPSYFFVIAENVDGSVRPFAFGGVAAGDPDGDTLAYSIVAGNDDGAFAIDPESGSLSYVGTGEDFETTPARELTVRATDPGGASADADVFIAIQNIAEAPVFDAADYAFAIDENVDGSDAPVPLGAVAAEGDALAYSIVAGNDDGAFAIDPESGSLSYVGTGEDFETASTRELTVRATSSGDASADATVTVAIGNVDEAPRFLDSAPIFTNTDNMQVEAVDPEGNAVTYRILPGDDASSFTIDSDTGELSVDGEGLFGTFKLTVEASDGELTSTVEVTVQAGGGGWMGRIFAAPTADDGARLFQLDSRDFDRDAASDSEPARGARQPPEQADMPLNGYTSMVDAGHASAAAAAGIEIAA